MVGKIKRVRQSLHIEAVKLNRPESAIRPARFELSYGLKEAPAPELQRRNLPNVNDTQINAAKQALVRSTVSSGIFASTEIAPEALVQTLTFEEPPHSVVVSKKGPEDKKIESKKEKMKKRRERWLNKISFIKQAKEQQAAEARRQATPVVGDMRPLADALPELSQLIGPAATAQTACQKRRKNKVPTKRRQTFDFSQMKQPQKRQFIETEMCRFSDAVKTLSSKKNPLADIGEQLRKRMRQEEEQGSG